MLLQLHSLSASPGTQQGAPILRTSPSCPLPRKYFLQIPKELTSSPPVSSSGMNNGLLRKESNLTFSWTSHRHVWCGYCYLPPPQTCFCPNGPHLREWSFLVPHSFSLDIPHVPQITTCCELCLLSISSNHALLLPQLPLSYFRLPRAPPASLLAPVLAPHPPTQLLKWFYIFQVNWFPYNMRLIMLFPCWKFLDGSSLLSKKY